jgi:voltage-gated potassium channel
MSEFQIALNRLYNGGSRHSIRFHYALVVFDIVTIAFFLVASFVETPTWFLVLDFMIAAVLILDLAARLWIARFKLRFLLKLTTLADVIVIATLLLPFLIENWAFLRVLRALRLLRSYHLLHDLRQQFRFFARNEEIIGSVLNLVVFIFIVTALVYVLEVRIHPDINNYVDALYFTVTTLTTTGFGDITLTGSVGRLLAIVIMVVGVGLFLRLVQTIFRPHKVRYKCPDCGLNRHEPDAVHCKHCGRTVQIETEGD